MTREQVHDLWPLGLMRQRAGAAPPDVEVVRPARVEDVREAMRSGRVVVPAGARSGVCGALAPGPDDLVLDLTGLVEIEIDAPNLSVRAGAGVNGMELERRLNDEGLTLGHFPSSLPATSVGGLLSTRSSGQQSTWAGSVEDMLMGLRVVLPDGRLVEGGIHPRSAVPDLAQLFLGAEGALGVVVEAVLRVRRLPEHTVGRGWRMPSVAAGLDAVREVMQLGLKPLVLRLYDPEDSLFQGLDDGCLLVGAAAGPAPVAEAEAAVMAGVVAGAGGEPLGEDPWERWLRHRFDLSADRLRDMLEGDGAFMDTIEVAASWTALPRVYEEIKAALGRHGLAMCHFSHAYPQGCCAYFTFAGSADDEAGAERAYTEAWRSAMESALAGGATITHHHGVGQARSPWVRRELSGWWHVWELVRGALDPEARMNPHALGGGGNR